MNQQSPTVVSPTCRVYKNGTVHHFGVGSFRGLTEQPGASANDRAIRAIEDADRAYRELMRNRDAQ